ncbi:MAG: CoA-binding protein [Verrucomicrobiales bacterium]|nr:CoA-binding protein [Verrucomicrobiales bacterium]
MNVVILGASDKPERFAYKAQKKLIAFGHDTFPVSLSGKDILDRKGFTSILEIPVEESPIHTATVYLNPGHFSGIVDDVLKAKPTRIILNPGTESAEIEERFRQAGVEVVRDCTLVMLDCGTF